MATEIANAYITLQTRMPGVKGDITKSLGGSDVRSAVASSGKSMGDRLLTGMGKALKVGAVAVGAAAVAGIGAAMVKGFQRLDAIDTARAKLTGLGHDASTVDTIMGNALASVKGTAFGLGDAATVAAQAVAAGIKPGKDLEGVLGTVANTAAAAGTDLGDMGSIFAKAMSQANGIQNDVLSQLADKGIPIYQALADQMGVTAGEVFKMASAGKINFETFAKAAEAAGGTVAQEMGGTWKGSFDNFMASLGRVGEGLLSGLFPQLKDGLRGVTEWLAPFEDGAKEVGAAVGGFVADAGPKLIEALKATFEAGMNVVSWIKDNATWLSTLTAGVAAGVGVWVVWTGAIATWTKVTAAAKAAQLALNAAMKANPIGLIVTAIGAVVAALVWFFTQTEVGKEIWAGFVQFLKEAWANISSFFMDAWNNVIKPVFTKIGEIATWLWETILQPVFNAIGAIFTWLWNAIVKPIIDFIVASFRVFGAIANWLWENAIGPVFNQIGAIFSWLWKWIIQPLIASFVLQFRVWGAIIKWLWENAVQPAFKKIGDIFTWVWQNVIRPIVNWVKARLEVLGAAFSWLYKNAIKPAWDKVTSVLRAGWAWIRDYVFAPFGKGISLIKKSFDVAVEGIKKAWNAIKAAAAKPINFVLDTVWNKGLRSFWNGVLGELGLNDLKLKKAPLIKFATGGVLPGYTPGRDVHEFTSPTGGRLALSGGEAIMRPEFTKAVGGPAGVARLNSAARRGEAFADGGVWGGIANFAGDVWDNITNAAAVAWKFLSDPGAAIQKYVIDGIIDPLLSNVGGGMFGDVIGSLPGRLMKSMTGKLEDAAPKGVGAAGMGWEAMWEIVRRAIPGVVKTSDYRPGAMTVNGGKSYHGSGRAIDLVPASMDTFNRVAQLFPNAAELIFSPAGPRQLLNGRPFNGWSDAVRAQHWNHVHLAMANGGVVPKLYDQGGWLPDGGMAFNKTGKPEAVLTPDESRALKKGVGGALINGDVTFQSSGDFGADLDKLNWELRRLARGGR